MNIGKQAPASQSTDMLVASYQCEGETQESVAPSSFLSGWFRELQRYTAGKCHRFKSRLPADAENPRLPFSGPFGVNLPEGLCMCLIKHWGKPKIFFWEHSTEEQLKGKRYLDIHHWDVTKDARDVRPERPRKKLVSLLFPLAGWEPPPGAQASVFSSWITMGSKTWPWGEDPKSHEHYRMFHLSKCQINIQTWPPLGED